MINVIVLGDRKLENVLYILVDCFLYRVNNRTLRSSKLPYCCKCERLMGLWLNSKLVTVTYMQNDNKKH